MRRRSGGCLSLIFTFCMLFGIVGLALVWVQRLTQRAAPTIGGQASIGAAQSAFDQGDLTGAINNAQNALTTQRDDIHTLYLLARALIYRSYGEYNRADDRAAALTVLREAAERNPRDVDMLAVYALTLAYGDQPARAAETALRALETPAASAAIAHTALALAYNQVGSYERALTESERAVSSAQSLPALTDALRVRAISLRDLGRYDEAITVIDRAIAQEGHLLALHFERAQFALLRGDSDGATVSYFAVLARDAGNIKARLRLCELSSVMRERERAVEYCQAVTEYAPAWVEGWFRLGMEYFLQGEFEQAQNALHRCATLQVLQNVPTEELRFECWYIQGQAAEIRDDCLNLPIIYNEWRTIAANHDVRQRWVYPPEGPPGCAAQNKN